MSTQSLRTQFPRPLLTIAIPTYNRAGCLRELLSGLAAQLKGESRVELLISDNASPDETPSVVQDLVAQGLSIRYLRNAQNIGADANFLQCFERAQGKYVWLFSDDDLIVPGGVAKIVSYCERSEYDLIWLSAYCFEEALKAKPAGVRSEATEISDPVEYAKRVHVYFTYISGNIINKDTVIAAGPKQFSQLIGTSLVQLGWTFTALSRFSRGLYVHEKLIAARLNNSGGYKVSQVFGSNLVAITKRWLQSEVLAQIVINGAVQKFWPSMLFKYKTCANAFTDQRKPQEVLTPLFGDNVRYWMFAYPVAVLPYHLSAVWQFLARVINRLDRAAGYPILVWGVARSAPTEARQQQRIG
jgi:abequosyltransferase